MVHDTIRANMGASGASVLVEWGVSAMVAEFRASQKPYMVGKLHCDEVTLAVMESMQGPHLAH